MYVERGVRFQSYAKERDLVILCRSRSEIKVPNKAPLKAKTASSLKVAAVGLGKKKTASTVGCHDGVNVCSDGFLLSSPSACFPFCLRPGGRGGGPQTNWKASGRFPFCLVAPLQAAAGYSINSSFYRRTTFGNNCAFRMECFQAKKRPFCS